MPSLAKLKTLQERLSIEAGDEYYSTLLQSLLVAATDYIESYVNTTFATGAHVDYFVLPKIDSQNSIAELKLSNCFVDSEVDVSVFEQIYPIDQEDSFVFEGTTIVDNEKGLVKLTGPYADTNRYTRDLYFPKYVRVEYTSGFSATEEKTPVYTGVPVWLSEACISYASILRNDFPGLVKDKQKVVKPGYMSAHVHTILNRLAVSDNATSCVHSG